MGLSSRFWKNLQGSGSADGCLLSRQPTFFGLNPHWQVPSKAFPEVTPGRRAPKNERRGRGGSSRQALLTTVGHL